MKLIPFGQLKRMTVPMFKEELPFKLTIEGGVEAVICKPNDVIVLGDLHPWVQKQLRNTEAKIRLGMPPDEKVYEDKTPRISED